MPHVPIVMPKMSMTMTEGELLTWHVKVGDVIKLGDVVCEVATDKIDMEVEATAAGTVVELRGNPGDVMDVGTPLVIVDAESDDLLAGIFDAPAAPAAAAEPAAAPTTPAAPAAAAAAPVPAAPAIINERPLATPHARAEAASLQVDLRTVPGTGSDGVVKVDDVRAAAESANSSERTIEARLKTRRAIARALEAASDVPSFSLTFVLDYPSALPTGADRTAALVSAWANTLRAFPELHADWNNGDLTTFPAVKVAVSVMAAHGVVTPVVTVPASPDSEFAGRLAAIITDAKRNHVAVEHLTSSTTGFVELESAAVVSATGLLVRPQSLAIAVGAGSESGLTVTITADHRICDPADLVLVARRFAGELGR